MAPTRRPAAGIAFLVGGLLILINIVLSFTAPGLAGWPVLLAYLALGIGFLVLALGEGLPLVPRLLLGVAGASWLVTLLAFVVPVPIELVALSALGGAIAGVAGAVLVVTGARGSDRGAIAFLVATVLAALMLVISAEWLGDFALLLVILVGGAFVLTGSLFLRPARAA